MRIDPLAPDSLLHKCDCIAQGTIGHISLDKQFFSNQWSVPVAPEKQGGNLGAVTKWTFCIETPFSLYSVLVEWVTACSSGLQSF